MPNLSPLPRWLPRAVRVFVHQWRWKRNVIFSREFYQNTRQKALMEGLCFAKDGRIEAAERMALLSEFCGKAVNRLASRPGPYPKRKKSQ